MIVNICLMIDISNTLRTPLRTPFYEHLCEHLAERWHPCGALAARQRLRLRRKDFRKDVHKGVPNEL